MRKLFVVNALFISSLVYSLATWLLVVLLSKYGGVREVGVFSLVLAVMGPLFAFTNMSMKSLQIIHDDDDYCFSNYLITRLIWIVIAVVLAMLVYSFYLETTAAFGVLVGILLFRMGESLADPCQGEYQREHKLLTLALSKFGRASISVLVFSLILISGVEYSKALVFWGATAVIFTVLFDFRRLNIFSHIREGLKSYKPQTFLQLTQEAMPLGLVLLINVFNANLGRFVINHYEGVEQVGIYSAIAHFYIVGTTFMGALAQFFARRLKQTLDTDLNKHYRIIVILMGMGLLGGIFGILVAYYFGEPLLRIVYTDAFAAHSDLLVWIMVAAMGIYVSSSLGEVITSRRIIKPQLWMNIVVSITLIVATVLLVKEYGLHGAAYALLIAYIVKIIVQFYLLFCHQNGILNDRSRSG